MKTIVYGLLLNSGQLANFDFGQGSHVTIYPTKEINLAYMDTKEEAEWWLNDYNKFKKLGIEGLFTENGNQHQYHLFNKECEPCKMVKIELKIIQ